MVSLVETLFEGDGLKEGCGKGGNSKEYSSREYIVCHYGYMLFVLAVKSVLYYFFSHATWGKHVHMAICSVPLAWLLKVPSSV